MKTLALIPLRGGSKSIPKKNIKPLPGKLVCAWVLEAATAATRIDAVYVSTDCPEIAAVVQGLNLGVQLIERPAELATDEASTEAVMLHCMTQCPFERLVTIQATSPLLRAEDLDTAVEVDNPADWQWTTKHLQQVDDHDAHHPRHPLAITRRHSVQQG